MGLEPVNGMYSFSRWVTLCLLPYGVVGNRLSLGIVGSHLAGGGEVSQGLVRTYLVVDSLPLQ